MNVETQWEQFNERNVEIIDVPTLLNTTTSVSDVELYPMDNFGHVEKGVYRSSHPKKKNFEFMRRLRLKTILTLVLEDYPEQNVNFMKEEGISFFQFGVTGNKEPFADIPEETISDALSIVLNRKNHPILIHCSKGRHRTGCLVGCLRKFQSWTYTTIFEEYRRYAEYKSRSIDLQFIELFDIMKVKYESSWLPRWAVDEISERYTKNKAQIQE